MTEPSPRRNPWPIRIAVGCGGIVLIGFLVIVGLVVWSFLPQRTAYGMCRSQVLGSRCTQVPVPTISRLMQMELPPDAVVRSSEYVDWQDDRLTAEVMVPAARVTAWEASLRGWSTTALCDDPTATCPPACAQGAVCATADDARVSRAYERYADPAGVRLVLRWSQK